MIGTVLALLLAGCASRPWGPYASPRVAGLVVAADTGKPIARVEVSRRAYESDGSLQPPKGGELLMRPAPALTGPDGRFVLASERVLTIFRGAGWNQVQLTFSRAGYLRLQTNFSLTIATNSPSGEPLVDIGQVALVPQP